jgi:sporulation protein YlmC with PRC-barrel domain
MVSRNDIQQLSGADVYASDGDKIGSVGQVYLEDHSGNAPVIGATTPVSIGTAATTRPARPRTTP